MKSNVILYTVSIQYFVSDLLQIFFSPQMLPVDGNVRPVPRIPPLLSINNACLWQVIGLHLVAVKQEYGCQSTQSVCHRPVHAEISW